MASARATLEAAERLQSFARPVLLAWGTEDRVSPIRLAETMLGILPQARLERIAGAGALVEISPIARPT